LSTFTQAQIDALQIYVDSRPKSARKRGLSYFQDRRVQQIEPDRHGVGFCADVMGTTLYRVKFRFAGKRWSVRCSCPVAIDCKHCCAGAYQAIAEANGDGFDEEGFEAEEEEDADGDDDGQAQAGAAPPPAPVTSRERKGKGRRKPGPDAEVADLFADRLGRKLSAAEKRAAQGVDALFKWHRTSNYITETLLEPITNNRVRWGWNSVQVWPTQPQTPWETWLYIVAYLRREKNSCPPTLIEATDPAEVDALTAAWRRGEQIEHWHGWLRNSAERNDTAPIELTELRVRVTDQGAQLEWRKAGAADFSAIKQTPYTQLTTGAHQGQFPFDEPSLAVWRVFNTGYDSHPFRSHEEPDAARILNQLLRLPGFEERVVGPEGNVFARAAEPLRWRIESTGTEKIDYQFALVLPDGSAPPPALTTLDGQPSLYVTSHTIFEGPPLSRLPVKEGTIWIPSEALETANGLTLLDRLNVPPPARVASRVRTVRMRVTFQCAVKTNVFGGGEALSVQVHAEGDDKASRARYVHAGWTRPVVPMDKGKSLTRYDNSALRLVPGLIETLRVGWAEYAGGWTRQIGKNFPAQFAEWLATVPKEVELELDPLLASLGGAPVEAQVKLEVEEAGIDWFDLRVALDVADSTLTPQEIKALLDARGGFVRLGEKGWRRLHFQLSEEDEKQLADLGLSARDFSSEPQRLHALQLAGKKAARRLLPEPQALAIERRASEIQTRVVPELPAGLQVELRPYQREGFHFLAYLSTNRFGGILADDMGLGKTVQTLAWLLWLRAQPDFTGVPSLVVCPKSVTDNWLSEGSKFTPELRVRVLARGASDKALKAARAEADLVVINYAQLRGLETALSSAPWHAAILDEAQYIKNPDSQTAKAAWALRAEQRLALSGTPIENRLLDLWSIMGFAMPGVLGKRAAFAKSFDQRGDPFARTRLAARVRPFVIRRTKTEVARDLPERTEEDQFCELEGEQATLYRAELKRARAALLNVKTTQQLDKQRFNILTSLLRLRQICCHPALLGARAENAESAKLAALLDLLEPIMAEGHKVLVFSQFVQMLEIIRAEIESRQWRHFLLTGDTEDRGPLVREFQESEGSAVFLISLRAGGFGLNLTAASYVVLFDPWWNPAVENQAIDRTHRIGQTSHVIAYRLLVKESIEEKIRKLQQSKSAMAADILGEENFTRALTLDDFRFLLGD
jgi:hypothetical protein